MAVLIRRTRVFTVSRFPMTKNISHFDPLFSRLIKNLWITPRRHRQTANFWLQPAKKPASVPLKPPVGAGDTCDEPDCEHSERPPRQTMCSYRGFDTVHDRARWKELCDVPDHIGQVVSYEHGPCRHYE